MNSESMKITEASNSQKRRCRHRHHKCKRRLSNDSSVCLLDEDKDLPLPIIQKRDSITNPKQNKRQVQVELQNGKVRDLRITQNFEIIKSKTQCITDKLDTDVITVRRNTSNKVLFRCRPPRERIIPTCTRRDCEQSYRRKFVYRLSTNTRKNQLNDKYKNTKNQDKEEHSHKHARFKKRTNSLSSISSVTLSDFCESLSSDSSDSEIELDSLIKRTKERDKQQKNIDGWLPLNRKNRIEQQKEFEASNHVRSSTPTDESSTCSENLNASFHSSTTYSADMNISIHSLATVVLDPLENSAYSPTNSLGFLTDNDESIVYYETFDTIGHDSSTMTREFNIDDLQLDHGIISPVKNEHSPLLVLSVDNEQMESDVSLTKLSIEQTDDYIIDTACLQPIKKEPNDDMFIIQSCNNNNDDYILWNDDGLLQEEIKIEGDMF